MTMQRRTLLQLIATAVAVPVTRVRLWAQPRELTAAAVEILHDIAPTVLPASIGTARTRAVVDAFAVWTRGYREGVPLAHGYGHPRLRKTGPSPAALYTTQLTALDRAARDKGGRFSTLDSTTRRALVDEALTAAGVK